MIGHDPGFFPSNNCKLIKFSKEAIDREYAMVQQSLVSSKIMMLQLFISGWA